MCRCGWRAAGSRPAERRAPTQRPPPPSLVNGACQALCFPLCVRAVAPLFSAARRGTVLGLWSTSCYAGGLLANLYAAEAARLAEGAERLARLPELPKEASERGPRLAVLRL